MQPADSDEQATAGRGFAHQPRAATSQGRILFPSASDEAADVCVSLSQHPSIQPASPSGPIFPRLHTSPSPPRFVVVVPLSIATGPADLPGPARRWYRTHAITKADMRSNDARGEEHSVNITLRDEVPRLIGSTSGNMRWIPLINSNLLLAHPTHQPPPYQIQAKTSSPLAWPPPHTECSAGSRNGLPMFL